MKEDEIKIKVIRIGLFGDVLVGKTSIFNASSNIEFTESLLSTIGRDKLETKFRLNNGNENKLII